MSEAESSIEQNLICQLTSGESQWTYRPDLKTEADLWNNVRKILETNNQEKLNGVPLSDKEFEQVKNQLTFPTFFDAACWIAGENGVAHVTVQRDTETVQLVTLKREDVAGGSSVYEVINQYQALSDEDSPTQKNRRFDVSLLINGIPLIHIELKNRNHPYMDGFRQIRKYIEEGRFKGIFSAVQMFVISNAAETKYFAAAQAEELNEKFLSGWADENSEPITNYLSFAKSLLSIPAAHHMVMQYTVMDKDDRRLLLLRPYQIHAIKAIRAASKVGKSGFIWHTTGSGKTMTSYKAARNLLMDIPSIDKTVFLIDRKDLDNQTNDAFQSYAQNDIIDVDETDNVTDLMKKLRNSSRNVIITTIQKLQILMNRRLAGKENTTEYKRIKNLRIAFVVDECHRTLTPKTKRALESFFTRSLWYGFTGTPIFAVNAYKVGGDLPKTTEELYGPCLHDYTVKKALHDGNVLGFQTEHLGKTGISDDDENEEFSVYNTEEFMLKVLDVIVNKSRAKFGFQNGSGKTYEALLTVNSIEKAQRYYDLLKAVKAGEKPLKISEETRRVLPDFPKFAITYSVSNDENSESSHVNVPKMKESLQDYNKMFGTNYVVDTIKNYNVNLNNRLARKETRYKSRTEQLDLVIVVDRLLTGFDAPCLSTLFIDRQPMQPQGIIQAFSRTNRLYDKNKTAGQIVTFQSPHKFKKAVDDALKLYSNGGETSVLAPDWETVKAEYDKQLKMMRIIAPTPDVIANFSMQAKMRFANVFQSFDKLYADLKSFTKYGECPPESYGITDDEYADYAAYYENIMEELRQLRNSGATGGEDSEESPLDEYELRAYSRERVDYEYIVSLIQNLVTDTTEEVENRDKKIAEVENYIQELTKANEKLGSLMRKMWEKILVDPGKYKNEEIGTIFVEMREDAVDKVINKFVEEWCVKKEAVQYTAEHYNTLTDDDNKILGLKTLRETADYERYKEKIGNDIPKFRYYSSMRNNLLQMLQKEILPLREEHNG
ncbi:MAG: HsdR family type I site-specific deoxyribonuclease [Oscillospiraceae bacterium]|nr:HsdR family type I site-specific deoxyribonuclease [Oscillospiraceae bacterium]